MATRKYSLIPIMVNNHHIDAFLEMMAAEKGASALTLSAYRSDLAAAQAFIKKPLLHATTADIETYLAHLAAERGFAAATIARHLSALKRFYRFCLSENWRADHPLHHTTPPKTRRPLPHSLHEEEIDRLTTALTSMVGFYASRLICLVELAYGSGLRVSELVGLKTEQWEQQEHYLEITGKREKTRLVPLSAEAIHALSTYWPLREKQLAGRFSPWLFPSNKAGKTHLTRQSFGRMLKDLALKAGISQPLSPHMLRHAFASHLLNNGADLRSVQLLLGHSDIRTTEIYTHISQDQLRAELIERHPLETGLMKRK
ncbi:MAG: tyrosine recombinase [Alphaproteobacteria bacterium]